MFFHRKISENKKTSKIKKLEYDPAEKQPVILCSICTGEQVAGLKNLRTKSFEEIMKISGAEDMRLFQEMCGTVDIRKEY